MRMRNLSFFFLINRDLSSFCYGSNFPFVFSQIPKLVHEEITHSSETLCTAVGRGVCTESFHRLFNIYSPENVYRSIFPREDNSDGLSFESRTFGFTRLMDLSPSEVTFLATNSFMERLLFSVMRWDQHFLDGLIESLTETMDDDPECSYLERGKVRAVARMLLMPSRSNTNLLRSKYATGPGDAPFEALVVPHEDRFLSNSRPLHSAYTYIPRVRAPPVCFSSIRFVLFIYYSKKKSFILLKKKFHLQFLFSLYRLVLTALIETLPTKCLKNYMTPG